MKPKLSKHTLGLLTEIEQAILEEPKRFLMTGWVNSQSTVAPCGTAACIGGHAILLEYIRRNPDLGWTAAAKSVFYFGALEARQALRIGYKHSQRLFYLDGWPKRFRRSFEQSNLGSRSRAKIAVARIRYFKRTGL